MIDMFRSFVKKKLFNLGLNLENNSNVDDIKEFISKFKANYVSTKLIRIGGDGDGGYLVPDILDDIKYCFSAGVGEISAFENDLSKIYQIKSFMADGSVDGPTIKDDNFFFLKKFLSSRSDDKFITLNKWIIESSIDHKANKILQMDIEDSEYEVLTYESEDTLNKFSLLIIEFHRMQNLTNKTFLKMIKANFEKIYKNFQICHVHPNNFSGIYNFKKIPIPSSIEITFIRKDYLSKLKINEEINLPHVLDKKNEKNIPDIFMPKIWWKN